MYSDQRFRNSGKLLCRTTYKVPNPQSATGMQTVVMSDLDTGIEITDTGGSYLDPVENQSMLVEPSFNDTNRCSHTPVFLTYYPMGPQGIQGRKGETGMAIGIDKTVLTEQIIPGEFFADSNSHRKQVYGKRVSLRVPFMANANGCYITAYSLITGISAITEISGFFSTPRLHDVANPETANSFFIASQAMINSSSLRTMVVTCSESSTWGANNMSLEIVHTNSEYVGKICKVEMFVKYVKL